MTAAVTQPITEAAWMDWVVELAHWHGWVVAHFRPARTAHGWRTAVGYDGKGWPDCQFVHPTRHLVLYREIKTDSGRLDTDQQRWGDWLTQAGADWAVWRPRDRDSVVATLTDGTWIVP